MIDDPPKITIFLLDLAFANPLHHGSTERDAKQRVGIHRLLPIMFANPLYSRSDDLWSLAATQLSDEDRRNIDFERLDKLQSLTDLHALTEKSKEECFKKRWKYTRKSGETVILRDICAKIIRWIDIFKQVGDVAVQYDPMHAALPWAGIRFILQVRNIKIELRHH